MLLSARCTSVKKANQVAKKPSLPSRQTVFVRFGWESDTFWAQVKHWCDWPRSNLFAAGQYKNQTSTNGLNPTMQTTAVPTNISPAAMADGLRFTVRGAGE